MTPIPSPPPPPPVWHPSWQPELRRGVLTDECRRCAHLRWRQRLMVVEAEMETGETRC